MATTVTQTLFQVCKKKKSTGKNDEITGTNFSHAAVVRRSQHEGCTSRRKQITQSFDAWKTRVKGFDILHEKDNSDNLK